ncbi:hypothetical protein ACWDA7_21500 [Streptomyces sp. NPDC001156]
MRALPARRLASSALCATLLLGITGPAAVAAGHDSARGRPQVATAPLPGADALLARAQELSSINSAVVPVTELVTAVLKADNGQLSASDAARLGKAAKDAIAKMGSPASPAPMTSPTRSASPAPMTSPTRSAVLGDALADLQTTVDRLMAAATSGDSTRVLPAAARVLGALVKVVVSDMIEGGLPAMSSLPPTPSLPPMPSLRPMPSPSLTAPSTASPSRPMM